MGANDHLSALNWGTSTGGSAGSAETSSTLGTARLNKQQPPDQYRIDGLQITRLVELATAVSQFYKGGTRLRVLKQSTNPFGASESGFYVSQAGTGYVVVDGTPTAIGAGGSSTLIQAYQQGAAASDQTLLIQSGDGGPVIFKANGAGTGSLVKAQTSGAADLIDFTDNASHTLKSAMADGASAVGLIVDTASAWSTAGNKLVSFRENGTEFGYITESSTANEFQLQSRASYSTALYGAVSVRLHSTAADGASAVAAYVDTSTAWSNASALLQSWRTNGSQKTFVDVAGNIGARGLFNTALGYGVKTVNGFIEITGGNLAPDTDGGLNSGGTSNHWNGTFSDFFETHMGSQLTAAASITPTTGFHHVTGATTIDTIAVTNFSGNPTLVLVADGGTITWSAAGNIKAAGTITQDKAQWFVYDTAASKWHPQQ